MKHLKVFLRGPVVLASLWGCVVVVQAQSLDTVEIVGKSDSLTQPSFESAQERVKAIPGGASVVDLDVTREGRQSTWSDSLGLAPGVFIKTDLALRKHVFQFVVLL